MEEPVRVRMVFEDRHVLTKSQRSEGLKRCWLLLRPDLATVADLASHLTHAFALRCSSPHDLVLSMDDFILPSFESTCIFKDKDIIRVRRKGCSVKEVLEIGNGHRMQDSEILEKQTLLSSNKLLAITEFKKDPGGYTSKTEDNAYAINENTPFMESPLEENANSKGKRKHSKKIQDSKRKKIKLTSPEKQDMTIADAENDHVEHGQGSPERVDTVKISSEKDKPSSKDDGSNVLIVSQVNDADNTPGYVPKEKRRKKLKPTSLEERDGTSKDADDYIDQRVTTLITSHRKDKPSKRDDRLDALLISQADVSVEDTPSSVPKEQRRKKLKPTSLEEREGTTKDSENNYMDQRVTTLKSSHRKDKPSKGDDRSNALVVSQADDSVENTPNSAPKERRRKKLKSTSLEERDGNYIDADNIYIDPRVATIKSSHRKDKTSKGDDRSDVLVISQTDDSVEITRSSVPKEPRHQDEINACKPHVNGVKEKFRSRSARRKKAKRQRRQEMAKSLIENHSESQVPADDIHMKSPEHRKMDQNNNMEDESIPVIVRPGHIRFEPIDAEKHKQQSNEQVETLQWNGTTNKKKGQKWGMEKTSSSSFYNACNGDTTGKSIAGDRNLLDKPINFESLHPLSCLPKEGDVIAYRIVELSSSWCPELSSFRVGKVASYDSISLKVILVPVPEHPIFPDEEKENAENSQPDLSSYKEDGSLEIDFLSLHDVRLFKVNLSEEIAVNTLHSEGTAEGGPVSNLKAASGSNRVTEKVTPINNWEVPSAKDTVKDKASSGLGTVNLDLSEEIAVISLHSTETQEAAPIGNLKAASGTNRVKERVAPINNGEVASSKDTVKEKAASSLGTANNREVASADDRVTEKAASSMDTPVNNWEAPPSNNCAKEKLADPKGKRTDKVWEHINQALSEKKAALQQNVRWANWNSNKDTTTPPWSYRVLRRSAVGPTMAWLRARNGELS